jgi:hypothetical protein
LLQAAMEDPVAMAIRPKLVEHGAHGVATTPSTDDARAVARRAAAAESITIANRPRALRCRRSVLRCLITLDLPCRWHSHAQSRRHGTSMHMTALWPRRRLRPSC